MSVGERPELVKQAYSSLRLWWSSPVGLNRQHQGAMRTSEVPDGGMVGVHLGRAQPLDPPDVAQDVLRLGQERLVEGRTGEMAQLLLAAATAAVPQGQVFGFRPLVGEGCPEVLLKGTYRHRLLLGKACSPQRAQLLSCCTVPFIKASADLCSTLLHGNQTG